MAQYKIYRQHNCTKNHRTYRTTAQCIWKRAEWVTGEGPYAVLAHCRVLTLTLHDTAEKAEASKAVIDSTACGGMCSGRHEVVQVMLPGGA